MLNSSMAKRTKSELVQTRFKERTRRKTYFREWRKYRGMTLEEAAPLADMTAGNLSAMERGAQGYTQDGLERLADAYRVPTGWLLDADPFSNESILAIWERAKDEDRAKIVDIAQTIIGKVGSNQR